MTPRKQFEWARRSLLKKSVAVALARDRIAYSRRSAAAIGFAREIVESANETLGKDVDQVLSQERWRCLFQNDIHRMQAETLFVSAILAPERLRDIGEALCNLKNGCSIVGDRPVAQELVTAYEQCASYRPTLPEVRRVFKNRGKLRWPGDFYARRLLRDTLGLNLRSAKRSRPSEAKSNSGAAVSSRGN